MQNIIRPSKQADRYELRNCPLCGEEYVNEHSVAPSAYVNLVVQIYECANKHSWEKYPGSIPAIASGPIDQAYQTESRGPPPFQDVYRPLHDTQEPVKRLFK